MRISKLSAILLTLVLSFSLFGCSSKNRLKYETVNVCVSPLNQRHIDTKQIKDDLEKEAIDKFLHKYKGFSSSNIVFKNRFYYNLEEMKKFCLKTKMAIKNKDIKKIKKHLNIKDYCYNAGETKVENLTQKAVDEGLKKNILTTYPKLKKADWRLVKRKIFNIKHSKPYINLSENTACLDIKADYYKDDLELMIKNKEFKVDNILLKEDFSDFKVGDSADLYGKKLVIQPTNDGKGLTTLTTHDVEAVFFAGNKEKVDIEVYLTHDIEKKFQNSELSFKILELNYSNRKEEDLVISLKKDEYNSFKADFALGRQKSENIDISFAKNYNVFKIEKNRREVKLYLNGKFTGAFFSSGDVLYKIRIPLNQSTILQAIKVKEKW